MKKSLFLLGVTAAVLSGCSNQEVMDVADAAGKYADLFWLMMWIGLGCAAIAMLASPWLRRAMRAAD